MQANAEVQHQAVVINKRHRQEYDALGNLAAPAIVMSKIKPIREQSKLSHSVFAAVPNTSISTVQKWAIG